MKDVGRSRKLAENGQSGYGIKRLGCGNKESVYSWLQDDVSLRPRVTMSGKFTEIPLVATSASRNNSQTLLEIVFTRRSDRLIRAN
jgi:hypothetical protein